MDDLKSNITQHLTDVAIWRTQVPTLLAAWKDHLKLQRAIFYECIYNSGGLLLQHPLGSAPTPLSPFADVSLREVGLDALHESLKLGERVRYNDASQFPKESAPFFQDTTYPIHFLPLMQGKQWWGTLRLEGELSESVLLNVKTALVSLAAEIQRLEAAHRAQLEAGQLEAVQSIASDETRSIPERIDALLALGLERLGLAMAIVSHIESAIGKYTVMHHAPVDSGLSVGQVFDLGQTYCNITIKAHRPIGIPYAGMSAEYNRHPCYEAFKLESYLGVAIAVKDAPYGTVNFSSPKGRDYPFTPLDQHLVESIGEAVAKLLEHV